MQNEKQTHRILVTLLMTVFTIIIFSAAGTFHAYGDQACGIIDSADSSGIRGWAIDSAHPDASVNVKVIITRQGDSQVVGQFHTDASGYREDLAALGTGNYAFDVSVPWSSYGDGLYLAEAYAAGQRLSGAKVYGVGASASLNVRSLGSFKTTAYCPCRSCSGGWGARTSTGTVAAAGRTVSVDPKIIPYGSRLLINGVIYTAEDRGGGVKGNHIDIFFNTHGETKNYGTKSAEVLLIQ